MPFVEPAAITEVRVGRGPVNRGVRAVSAARRDRGFVILDQGTGVVPGGGSSSTARPPRS
jgi:hypothetical protein